MINTQLIKTIKKKKIDTPSSFADVGHIATVRASEKSKIEAEVSKLQLQLRSLQQQEQYLTNLVLTKTKTPGQAPTRQRQQTLMCQKNPETIVKPATAVQLNTVSSMNTISSSSTKSETHSKADQHPSVISDPFVIDDELATMILKVQPPTKPEKYGRK